MATDDDLNKRMAQLADHLTATAVLHAIKIVEVVRPIIIADQDRADRERHYDFLIRELRSLVGLPNDPPFKFPDEAPPDHKVTRA